MVLASLALARAERSQIAPPSGPVASLAASGLSPHDPVLPPHIAGPP
jgi:hypothetical protein